MFVSTSKGSVLTCAAQRPPSTDRSEAYATKHLRATMARRWVRQVQHLARRQSAFIPRDP